MHKRLVRGKSRPNPRTLESAATVAVDPAPKSGESSPTLPPQDNAGAEATTAPPNDAPRQEKTESARETTVPVVPAQCLTFFVAGDEYAAGILKIREIVEYPTVTTVPTAPPWVRGVMNLRGVVVPLVDLALKLGLAETAITRRTCIVVVEVDLEGEESVMGLLVDGVSRVIDVACEAFESIPAFGTPVPLDCLLGMAKESDSLVPILNLNRIISTGEELRLATSSARTPVNTAGHGDHKVVSRR